MTEIIKKRIDKGGLFALLFVVASLPWSVKLSNAGIIVSVFLWMISLSFNRSINRNQIVLLVVFVFYFLGLIVSFAFASETSIAWPMLETRLGVIILPLIFFIGKFNSARDVKLIATVFSVSVIIITFQIFENGIDFLNQENRIFALQEIFTIHRPYLGVYCSVSIIFLCSFCFENQSRLIKFSIVAACIYLLFVLYAIVAKSAIVGLIVALATMLLIKLLELNKTKLVLISILSGIIFSLVIYSANNRLKNLVDSILTFNYLSYDQYAPDLIDSFNRRFEMWKCSFDILKSDGYWLHGVGLGNEQVWLDDCYSKSHLSHMASQSFNSHNQFLQDFLTGGIVFAFLFLTIMLGPLYFAIRDRSYTLIGFIIIVMVFSVSESFLLRQKGIILYFLFVCMLVLNKKVGLAKPSGQSQFFKI